MYSRMQCEESHFRGVHIFCTAVYCLLAVETKRMSQPDMGSIFHIKNQWNIFVAWNYYVNFQNSMLLSSSDTKLTLMYLFLFINSTQRDLFQHVRRVYATAINFPCIITLNKYEFKALNIRDISVNLVLTSITCVYLESWDPPPQIQDPAVLSLSA